MSLHILVLRKPASWLVTVCERSENRGSGGGGCPKGTKIGCAPVTGARKRSILLGDVPLGNLLTVGYRFPLGPPFWWPEKRRGCRGKYLFSRPLGGGVPRSVNGLNLYTYYTFETTGGSHPRVTKQALAFVPPLLRFTCSVVFTCTRLILGRKLSKIMSRTLRTSHVLLD